MLNVWLYSPFMHSQSVKNQQMLNQKIPVLSCLHLTSLLKCLPTISWHGEHSYGELGGKNQEFSVSVTASFCTLWPMWGHTVHNKGSHAFCLLCCSTFFGFQQHFLLSAWRMPVILVRTHWKKRQSSYAHTQSTSHTTCAIRSVKPVQMSSLRVAGVLSRAAIWFSQQSLLIVPPDQFVWCLNIHVLRLA